MGRTAVGVRGIKLREGDFVVGAGVAAEGTTVLSITENGYGKRTEVEEYRIQTRGGKGIKAMNLTNKTGALTCQLLVRDDEDLLIITDDGTVIRMPVADISTLGRNTQGVRVMRPALGSRVIDMEKTDREEAEPVESPEESTEA